MKDLILVLTNSQDGKHSSSVISKILEAGRNVFRFDVDKIGKGELKITFKADSNGIELNASCFNQAIALDDIGSIWYRRPNYFDFQIKDSVQRSYAESELKSFLDNLWEFTDTAFWLNNPKSLERARKKIYQLKIAREIGFKIPDTIVTNNPTEAKKFFLQHRKQIIFKAIYHEFLNYGEKNFNIPTTLITERHLEKINLINYMPALFQEFIEKDYELRVTVVGEKFFAVKIDSQKYPETIVDFRNPDFIEKLNYESISLSQDIANKCFALMKHFNLEFGAFDFILSKSGELYFLEVNPNGQWYWLEDLTGVLISDAIADILINKSFERR